MSVLLPALFEEYFCFKISTLFRVMQLLRPTRQHTPAALDQYRHSRKVEYMHTRRGSRKRERDLHPNTKPELLSARKSKRAHLKLFAQTKTEGGRGWHGESEADELFVFLYISGEKSFLKLKRDRTRLRWCIHHVVRGRRARLSLIARGEKTIRKEAIVRSRNETVVGRSLTGWLLTGVAFIITLICTAPAV
jgi:hypothetical protein